MGTDLAKLAQAGRRIAATIAGPADSLYGVVPTSWPIPKDLNARRK